MSSKPIVVLLVLIVGIGCDPIDRITIHNNSQTVIYTYITCDDTIALIPNMERFVHMSRNGNKETIEPDYRIPANEFKEMTIIGTWSSFISDCPDRKLKVFLLTEKMLADFKWDQIVSGQIFEKKLEYTVSELDSLKWVIRYP